MTRGIDLAILVTGGAGFIGSHLIDKLIERDDKVICLDNFDPHYDPKIKENNIQTHADDKNFTFIEASVTDQKALKTVFEENEVAKVVHLAAKVGVRPSLKEPLTYQKINIRGTLTLLELSRKYEVENFVFGSSSSVYGEVKETPFREDMSINPISPYGATKLCGEILTHTYSELYDLPSCALRFFTVYGPRQRPEMAIHKFTRLIKQGKEVPMYGDGTSQRDYTYIDDIIQGVTSALDKKFEFEVINLGNSDPIKLRDLISLIEKELDMEAKINRLPDQPGDVPITYADVTKAKELLNYSPKVKLEEGIKKFVDWHAANMG